MECDAMAAGGEADGDGLEQAVDFATGVDQCRL